MSADDERLGQLFRLLRRQAGLTQEEISVATTIRVLDIHKLETGRADELLVDRVRLLFVQVDARTRLSVWWRGAAADRLLDEEHSAIVEGGARVLVRRNWERSSS